MNGFNNNYNNLKYGNAIRIRWKNLKLSKRTTTSDTVRINSVGKIFYHLLNVYSCRPFES